MVRLSSTTYLFDMEKSEVLENYTRQVKENVNCKMSFLRYL